MRFVKAILALVIGCIFLYWLKANIETVPFGVSEVIAVITAIAIYSNFLK